MVSAELGWEEQEREGRQRAGVIGRTKSGGDSEERKCGSADVVWVCGSCGAQRSKEGKTRIKKPRVWGSGPIRVGLVLGWSVWRRVWSLVCEKVACVDETEEAARERS